MRRAGKSTQHGISVLMPVRDGGRYLKAAVNSILQQEDVLLELVLIDDHSQDGAVQALAADDRMTVISSPEPGIVPALNAGIAHARYPWLARMDADDVAAPNRLALQLDYLLANPEVDICATRVRMFREDEEVGQGYQHYEQWINNLHLHADIEREFFIESPLPHPTVMLYRDTLLGLGGYQDCAWPEDYDLWSRALLAGLRFGKPDSAPLLNWRDQGNRLSRTDARYNKQHFLQCKAHYLNQYLQARGIHTCAIWGTGPTGLKLHDYLEQAGMMITQFIDVNPNMSGRKKRGKPVSILRPDASSHELSRMFKEYKGVPDTLIVVAVSARGARQEIGDCLREFDLVEQKDFIFAA
ncbi:MAG: glycosyltransferase [Pseudomonadota bacterium]